MIAQVTQECEGALTGFFYAHAHPQLTKISCHYRAYGLQYDFCRFFLCTEGTAATAAVCLFGDAALVYAAVSGSPELTQFLSALPVHSVSVNAAASDMVAQPRAGSIMTCSPAAPAAPLAGGRIDDAFAILRQAFGEEHYNEENYHGWYCEMSHGIRHGITRLFLDGGATVTARFIGDAQVVLNQVAVLPSEQGRGSGTRLVRRAAAQFPGKEVFVYSRSREIDAFYQRAGFAYYEDWIQA